MGEYKVPKCLTPVCDALMEADEHNLEIFRDHLNGIPYNDIIKEVFQDLLEVFESLDFSKLITFEMLRAIVDIRARINNHAGYLIHFDEYIENFSNAPDLLYRFLKLEPRYFARILLDLHSRENLEQVDRTGMDYERIIMLEDAIADADLRLLETIAYARENVHIPEKVERLLKS